MPVSSYVDAMERLLHVVQELSLARDLQTIMTIVRREARTLTGADGATFILRDSDQCYYADEDAIEPLWKGRRFPMSSCISGWVMLHRQQAVIEDIYVDERIPHEAYRPTFVKSLAMVPIRALEPIGAIGTYWARKRIPSEQEVRLLQALADTTAVAIENVQVYTELEQRVRDRTAELEAANRELETFSYSVSHDLRAPVRAINGFCRLLRTDHEGVLDTEARRKLDIVAHEGNRLSTMIDDLLNFSRLGRGSLDTVDVDMTVLARETFQRLLQGSESKVRFCLETLPRARADRALIGHVWTNLLSNALKFSSGKAQPTIQVSGSSGKSEQVYTVRDNGAGFDPRNAEKLFDVFQRFHPENPFPGTGVGLALAQRIIVRHGGRIWAEGEPGQGAAFHFALPATYQPSDVKH